MKLHWAGITVELFVSFWGWCYIIYHEGNKNINVPRRDRLHDAISK